VAVTVVDPASMFAPYPTAVPDAVTDHDLAWLNEHARIANYPGFERQRDTDSRAALTGWISTTLIRG
jgi:hypothetical protein